MNAPLRIVTTPEKARLRIEDFLLLRGQGAFAKYTRPELLEGELWGIIMPDSGGDPETDLSVPIPLTVDDYALVSAAGSLAGAQKTELIGGVIYSMSPQYRRHGYIKDELTYRLRQTLEAAGSDLHVATEQSVRFDVHNEPQPDIILTREPRGDGPIPGESVALIVEVSATTLMFDLGEKEALYARAGIAEYWVVDVEGRVIHQIWAPSGKAYAERREHAFGVVVEAATLANVSVATGGLG